MGNEWETAAHWKWVAIAALVSCGLLAVALATAITYATRSSPQPVAFADNRLLGTWQSDTDRTVAEWRERRPMTDEQASALRKVLAVSVRVTFTKSGRTVELPDRVATDPYEVVGRDDVSVVILARDLDSSAGRLTHIHFVDADTFWIHAELAPMREYFKRAQ